MKQQLDIAAALLGDPPVLMFDEPVNSLDPEGIRLAGGGVHGTHPGQRRLPRRPARHFPKRQPDMTIVTAAAPARARNVLVSEWIKFRSVRSTDLTLVLAAVAAVPGQPVGGYGPLLARQDLAPLVVHQMHEWIARINAQRMSILQPSGTPCSRCTWLTADRSWRRGGFSTRRPPPSCRAAQRSAGISASRRRVRVGAHPSPASAVRGAVGRVWSSAFRPASAIAASSSGRTPDTPIPPAHWSSTMTGIPPSRG